MLALARALAVTPKLIIADEMSLGLAPLVAEDVFEGLDEARRSGITVVLIEQFVHRALALADQCVILSRGRVGWSGPAVGRPSRDHRPISRRSCAQRMNPPEQAPPVDHTSAQNSGTCVEDRSLAAFRSSLVEWLSANLTPEVR